MTGRRQRRRGYPHLAATVLFVALGVVGVVGSGFFWWRLWLYIDPPPRAPVGWTITLKDGGVQTTTELPEWSYNGWLCWFPEEGEQVCTPAEQVVTIAGPKAKDR